MHEKDVIVCTKLGLPTNYTGLYKVGNGPDNQESKYLIFSHCFTFASAQKSRLKTHSEQSESFLSFTLYSLGYLRGQARSKMHSQYSFLSLTFSFIDRAFEKKKKSNFQISIRSLSLSSGVPSSSAFGFPTNYFGLSARPFQSLFYLIARCPGTKSLHRV